VSQVIVSLLFLIAPLGELLAQEFQPPRSRPSETGTRVGLFGFGVHGGADVTDPVQIVLGAGLDLGNLFTSRFRIRATAEVGIDGEDSFVASVEGLYRFTGDHEATVPYVGSGVSVAGHDDCGMDDDCPAVWFNIVFGFERRFRSTFNWMLEYHGMDALRRHRFYFGFVTRRGG
jgi:hypothetical protein